MSGDIVLSTSPRSQLLHSGSLIRMEQAIPFNPRTFLVNAHDDTHSDEDDPRNHGHRDHGHRDHGHQDHGSYKAGYQEPPAQRRLGWTLAIGVLVASCVTFTVSIGMITFYLLKSLVATNGEVWPFLQKSMSRTNNILNNLDQASEGTRDMVAGVSSVANVAVPALQYALNESKLMLTRLERLTHHPVVQLSLVGN